MKRDAILAFLQAIGADMSAVKENKNWVNCRCPLAPFTHERGDTIPSFGIAINDGGHSVWQCFGCSPKARRLDKLLTALFVASGAYPFRAARVFSQNENFIGGSRELDLANIVFDAWEVNHVRKSRLLSDTEKVPIRGHALRNFPLLQNDDSEIAGRCRYYLSSRGIPSWVQYYLGVRVLPDDPVLLFPLTDHDGNIYTIRARHVYEKKMWTLDETFLEEPPQKIKQTGVWFGLHLVNWEMAATLVEGEIDMMSLVSMGYFNSIASATSSVTEEQLENLKGFVYFLGYDSDKSGKRARERVIDYMKDQVALFDLDWAIVKNKKGEPCKDANDVPDKKALRYVYKHAKYIC